MSLKVTIEGLATVDIPAECVRKVTYSTDIPAGSDARSKDVGSSLTIVGRILTAVDGDPFDSTRELDLWGMMAAEEADCYRKVTVEVMSAGVVERKYYFPNAFVVKQTEDFGDSEGVGTFTLTVKQKKDKMGGITIEGGYSA